MKIKKNAELIRAFQIGTVCVFSYLVCYYMRNVISVTSPEMLSAGIFTKEFIGLLSSVYMFLYASGQLINGVMGDIVKPKYMIVGGMVFSGLSSILFALINQPLVQIVLFALIGFSLSMLRGPLVKTISENTLPGHSRVICTFFSFASFAGPLIASLISLFFNWRYTFIVAGIFALIVGFFVYLIFTLFERKGYITYSLSKKSSNFKNIFKVFRLKHFGFYVFVGAIAEISAASISSWLPTYFTEQLYISQDTAKIIFSAIAICKSATPFITLFIFTLLKEKDVKMARFSFVFATLFFIGMYFIKTPYLNILCLLLAQISIGSASSLLWSIYIPSQRESGMVSTVNGVLDFCGYIFAGVANIIFAYAIGDLGWNGTIILWIGMTFIGAVVAMLTKQEK